MYKTVGTVTFIDETERPSPTFTKRTFGITNEGSAYSPEIYVDAVRSNIDMLNDLRIGDLVQVGFTIVCSSPAARDGSKKKLRFTNLQVATIEKLKAVKAEEVQLPEIKEPAPVAVTEINTNL